MKISIIYFKGQWRFLTLNVTFLLVKLPSDSFYTPKTYFPPSGLHLAPASVFIFPSSLQINVHTGVTDSEV